MPIQITERLVQSLPPAAVINPVSQGAGTVLTGAIDTRLNKRAYFILATGVLGASATVDFSSLGTQPAAARMPRRSQIRPSPRLSRRPAIIYRSYAVGLFSADLRASPLINTPPFGLLGRVAAQIGDINGSQEVRTSLCNCVTPRNLRRARAER